jgi:hypothetical protein
MLLTHCKPYEKRGEFVVWHDRLIPVGALWKAEIERELNVSNAAVLLIGPEFLASDFVQDEELPRLLVRASNRGAPIFPIIVEGCSFEDSSLSAYQSFNAPSQPLAAESVSSANMKMVNFVMMVARRLKSTSPAAQG